MDLHRLIDNYSATDITFLAIGLFLIIHLAIRVRTMTDSSQASSATVRGQPMRKAILTDKAPPPLPFYSQAIVCNGMVYCSGNIGISPVTKQLIDGGIGDRTVGLPVTWYRSISC